MTRAEIKVEHQKAGASCFDCPEILEAAVSVTERLLREQRAELAQRLREWWRFDDFQRPVSTWHDREDFIKNQLLRCAPQEKP